MNDGNLCLCGCGTKIKVDRKVVKGHTWRKNSPFRPKRFGRNPGWKLTPKWIETHLGDRNPSLREDVKKKISEASRRMWTNMTKEMRENIRAKKSLHFSGDRNPSKRPEAKEWCRRGGLWHRGRKDGPMSAEHKEKIRISHLGKKHSPEFCALMSNIHSKRTKETCSGRRSQAIKMSGENNPAKRPEVRRKILKSLFAGPNKAEGRLLCILECAFPGEWRFVGNGDLIIDGKCPDFVNTNGKKALIELYGDFWHKGDDPAKRQKYFATFGYQTLVIWEHELKSEKKVIDKVKGGFV